MEWLENVQLQGLMPLSKAFYYSRYLLSRMQGIKFVSMEARGGRQRKYNLGCKAIRESHRKENNVKMPVRQAKVQERVTHLRTISPGKASVSHRAVYCSCMFLPSSAES